MNIKKNICSNFSERGSWKPDVIVIHTAGGTEKSMDNWFHNPTSQASAHYGIGFDGHIEQYVEEDKKAWSCGNVNNPTSEIVISRPNVNPNFYTINIENEGYDLNKDCTKEEWASLIELIKDISKRHNIPLDRKHIIGHYEISSIKGQKADRSYCPSKNHDIMEKLVNELKDNKLDNIKVKLKELTELINSL